MQVNATNLGFLFRNSAGGTDLALLGQGRTSTGTTAQRDPIATLKDAEKNGARQIAAKSLEPAIRREIEDFAKGVLKAKTVDELLDNPRVTRVLLTANGLEEFANAKGLVKRALTSDPNDETSVAVKLAATNANWLEAARTYQFSSKGVAILQKPDTIKAVTDAYAEVRWRESLDASAPGVAAALTFKEGAASIKSPFQILGNSVYRQVVTTALGLPDRIAFQSVETQARAITSRLDINKLQDPAFVDAMARRFLINLNSTGSSGGITA